MPRFVVVYHQLPAEESRRSHWDLMFEHDDVLWTWAVEESPLANGSRARQLPDHRPFYLGYEGPVSGNRGFVTRWDGGEYTLVDRQADRFCVELEGTKLRGRLTLERAPQKAEEGTSSCSPQPAASSLTDHFWIVSFSGASATDASGSSDSAGG